MKLEFCITSISHDIAIRLGRSDNPLNDGIASSSRGGRSRNDVPLDFRNSVFASGAYLITLVLLSWYTRLPLAALPTWTPLAPLAIAAAVALTYHWLQLVSVPRWLLILSIALAWAVFFFTPKPVTLLLDDRLHYYFHAKMAVDYGLNPFAVPPSAAASDPDFSAVAVWHYFQFNYGPLWLAITALPVWATSTMAAAMLTLQGLIVAAAAAGGWVSGKLEAARFSWRRAVAFALHPLILVWGISGGHNDVLVALGLLVALWAWQRGRPLTAVATVVVAALVKPVAIIWWPLLLAAALATGEPRQRLTRAVAGIGTMLGLLVGAYVPVWPGWSTLGGSVHTGNPKLAGPLVGLLGPWVGASAVSIAGIAFAVVYALVLWRLMSRPLTLPRLAAAGAVVGLALLAASPLLQPWYALWLVPFLPLVQRPWARWVEAALVIASLTSYSVWYPLGFGFGWLVIAGATGLLALGIRLLAARCHWVRV